MEEQTYTCTRCGNSTHYQAMNPWSVSHPLGRFCKYCLPVLFQEKTAQELIVEAAQYRSAIRGSFVPEHVPLPEYEEMQFAPSDWSVKPNENKEAEDPEAPRSLVRSEQPFDFPVDVPENGRELTFTVWYWCAHGCGNHFQGTLRVRKVNDELLFSRDRCPECGDEGTSPHVAPKSITTDENLTLHHYAEAIKLALSERWWFTHTNGF